MMNPQITASQKHLIVCEAYARVRELLEMWRATRVPAFRRHLREAIRTLHWFESFEVANDY